MLLTCRANRFYASGFDSHGTDGACLITPDAVCYWTDGRYIEAARNQISGRGGLPGRPSELYEALAAAAVNASPSGGWALTTKP